MSTTFDTVSKTWSRPVDIKTTLLSNECLGDVILKRLQLLPADNILEVNFDNGVRKSVRDIREASISCAINLQKLGVRKGDVVVIFSASNSFTTPLILGSILIGALINPFDIYLDDDVTDSILKQLNPTVLIYDEIYQDRIQRISLRNAKFILSLTKCQETLLKADENIESFQPPHLGPPDAAIAALLLTSGSTGVPKVIALSHSELYCGIARWWPLDESSIMFIPSPLRWVSQFSIVFQPILLGGCRVSTSQPITADLCCNIIQREKVTHFLGMSGLLLEMLAMAENSDCLDTVTTMLSGGEFVPASVLHQTNRLLPKCNISKVYGMSELGGVITSNASLEDKSINGGELKPGVSLQIVDENGNLLGCNERGQMRVKLGSKFMGYYNNEKANKDAYMEDGWFHTGDYAWMDQSNSLNVICRFKDVIQCSGCLIPPSDIEVILDQHPLVGISTVVGVSNGAEQIPVAFIVLKTKNEDSSVAVDAILNYFNAQADRYMRGMLTQVHIIDCMPHTVTSRKVDKLKLKTWAANKIRY